MQVLNKDIFNQKRSHQPISAETILSLPEKIIQFGNGVLLRGLPDYYVDNSNKSGVFNGRIVVVKSTPGDTSDFDAQDYLYTHCIKGIENGQAIESIEINASISRVLSAYEQWDEVLKCASNKEINVVFSNTTEQGIVFLQETVIDCIPKSFPGKLLAYLCHRYEKLGDGDDAKICIVPCELIENNGDELKTILRKLIQFNELSPAFETWFANQVIICNSLVDRIVPGKPQEEILQNYFQTLQYEDGYLIESEPYNLWAIEGAGHVKKMLSFHTINSGIKIVDDISLFKELKLRLLNATHIFCVGKALLDGFNTVSEAMENDVFNEFTICVTDDIKISISQEIDEDLKAKFAIAVLDRFRNPSIHHMWTSIIFNYSEKFKIRCMPLIENHFKIFGHFSQPMIEGLAMFFKISIPDLCEENNFYTYINETKIKLNDPCSKELFEMKNQYGEMKTIQYFIKNYFMAQSTIAEVDKLTTEVENYFMSLEIQKL